MLADGTTSYSENFGIELLERGTRFQYGSTLSFGERHAKASSAGSNAITLAPTAAPARILNHRRPGRTLPANSDGDRGMQGDRLVSRVHGMEPRAREPVEPARSVPRGHQGHSPTPRSSGAKSFRLSCGLLWKGEHPAGLDTSEVLATEAFIRRPRSGERQSDRLALLPRIGGTSPTAANIEGHLRTWRSRQSKTNRKHALPRVNLKIDTLTGENKNWAVLRSCESEVTSSRQLFPSAGLRRVQLGYSLRCAREVFR